MEITEKLQGWFDVKVYNDRKPREEWKLKGDDENIAFTTTLEAPGAFNKFAKICEKDGKTYYRITFKIGPKARWYDGNAHEIERPSNAELDGVKFEVRIQYREVIPEPGNDKAPRGYWVNSIQMQRVDINPFQAFAPGFIADEVAAPAAAPAEMFQDIATNGGDADLPY